MNLSLKIEQTGEKFWAWRYVVTDQISGDAMACGMRRFEADARASGLERMADIKRDARDEEVAAAMRAAGKRRQFSVGDGVIVQRACHPFFEEGDIGVVTSCPPARRGAVL